MQKSLCFPLWDKVSSHLVRIVQRALNYRLIRIFRKINSLVNQLVNSAFFSLYLHMKKLLLLLLACPAILKAQPGFTGPHTSWHENFARYDFIMDTATLSIT